MAKANLLNTSTTNFLELIGNGRTYHVPPYQRDYSWVEEHWEDLWNDLMELRPRPDATHYMGALVVEGKSDREFAIIDGQQRFATLSLLVLAVIGRLSMLADHGIEAEANRERAAALRARYIGEKDPASLIESSKLALNSTDGGFYQEKQLPGANQADFAPRIKAPTLLISGKFDWIFLGKDALLRLIGAPAADKKALTLETAHDVSEERAALIREVLAWLDRYLGKIQ